MDILFLNDAYTPIDTFDDHITFSWIERFDEPGEFNITVDNTEVNKELFQENRMLGIQQSSRVMIIRTVEEKDVDGRSILEISGPSHEDFLSKRTMLSFETWTGTAAQLARRAFNETVVTPPIPADQLAYYDPFNHYGPGGLDEDDEIFEIETHGDNLHTFIQSMCQLKSMGYRLVRVPGQPKVQFSVYTGTNRTIRQNLIPPVLFDPSIDTLTNVSALTNSANYYNIAYVVDTDYAKHVVSVARAGQNLPTGDNANPVHVYISNTTQTLRTSGYLNWLIQQGRNALALPANASRNVAIVHPRMASNTLVVLPEGETVEPTGANRMVLHVNPSDLDVDIYDPNYVKLATTYAKQALADHKREFLLDGQIPSDNPYVYERDYFLGDIVSIRNHMGDQNMRIVEQSFTEDDQGERSFPTLRKEDEWRSDVWSSQPENLYWDNAQGTWIEQ